MKLWEHMHGGDMSTCLRERSGSHNCWQGFYVERAIGRGVPILAPLQFILKTCACVWYFPIVTRLIFICVGKTCRLNKRDVFYHAFLIFPPPRVSELGTVYDGGWNVPLFVNDFFKSALKKIYFNSFFWYLSTIDPNPVFRCFQTVEKANLHIN